MRQEHHSNIDEHIRRTLHDEAVDMKLDRRVKEQIVDQAKPSIWERKVRINLTAITVFGCIYVLLVAAPALLQKEVERTPTRQIHNAAQEKEVRYVIDGNYLIRQDLFGRERNAER